MHNPHVERILKNNELNFIYFTTMRKQVITTPTNHVHWRQCLCGRKLEYRAINHQSDIVTTWTSCIQTPCNDSGFTAVRVVFVTTAQSIITCLLHHVLHLLALKI